MNGRPHTLRVPLVKMHGCGNDYLIVEADSVIGAGDGRVDETTFRRSVTPQLCDRRFGVGADGVMLLRTAPHPPRTDTPNTTDTPDDRSTDADRTPRLRADVLNADGSLGDFCGNGLRCLVRYAAREKLFTGDSLVVETGAGPIQARLSTDSPDRVELTIAPPTLDLHRLPLDLSRLDSVEPIETPASGGAAILTVAGRRGVLIGVGNPHFVVVSSAPSLHREPLIATPNAAGYGPLLETHPAFPNHTNVHAVRVLDRSHLEAINHERGVGETLACGSGACAIAVACRLLNLVEPHVAVRMPGGTLDVQWDGPGAQLRLAGPTQRVFSGVAEIPIDAETESPRHL